jgi:hypothetical protein
MFIFCLLSRARNIKQMSFCKCQKAKGINPLSVWTAKALAGWLASQ